MWALALTQLPTLIARGLTADWSVQVMLFDVLVTCL